MKRICNTIMVAAVAALAISCNKETSPEDYPTDEGKGTPLSITVGTETKTLLRPSSSDAGEVRWSADDKMKIFNESKNGSIFTTETGNLKEATFTCESWVGGTPKVAVHSSNAAGSKCMDATDSPKVKTFINPVQQIKHKSSYAVGASASMGLVSGSAGAYSIEAMKNLFSLIKFKVQDTSIVKVTMKGTNGEVLAGWVNVDYNSGEPTCTPVTGGGDSLATSLEMTANGSACKVKDSKRFQAGTDYYIAALPQTLLNGFSLELQKENGAKATRTISSSVELARNEIRSLKHPLDSALAFEPITMNLSFTGTTWPFNEEITATGDQKKTGTEGETYTYTYTDDDGENKTCSFEIANPNSTADKNYYTYTANKFLKFFEPGTGAWIKLPAIEGRKLYSVTVTVSNTSAKKYLIKTSLDASGSLFAASIGVAEGYLPSATYTDAFLNYNTSYYIYLSSGKNFQLTELTLVYDK